MSGRVWVGRRLIADMFADSAKRHRGGDALEARGRLEQRDSPFAVGQRGGARSSGR